MRSGEGETKITAMDLETGRAASAGEKGGRRGDKFPGGIMVTTQVDVRGDAKSET